MSNYSSEQNVNLPFVTKTERSIGSTNSDYVHHSFLFSNDAHVTFTQHGVDHFSVTLHKEGVSSVNVDTRLDGNGKHVVDAYGCKVDGTWYEMSTASDLRATIDEQENEIARLRRINDEQSDTLSAHIDIARRQGEEIRNLRALLEQARDDEAQQRQLRVQAEDRASALEGDIVGYQDDVRETERAYRELKTIVRSFLDLGREAQETMNN